MRRDPVLFALVTAGAVALGTAVYVVGSVLSDGQRPSPAPWSADLSSVSETRRIIDLAEKAVRP